MDRALSSQARPALREPAATGDRAAMPPGPAPNGDLDLLFVEDLAQMFRIDLPAVRKRLRLGQFGPFLRVGKRMAVLRSSLRDFLHASQIQIK